MNHLQAGQAERVLGQEVSANFLNTLRVAPALGSDFPRGSNGSLADLNTVLLSHAWWLHRFGGDPSIIGRSITLNRTRFTVVGILPPEALLRDDVAFLRPVDVESAPEDWRRDPGNPWAGAIARLRAGTGLLQAQAAIDAAVAESDRAAGSAAPRQTRIVARSLHSVLVAPVRPTLLILAAAVASVLMIACAIIANLLLARAASRRREMAIRGALGASGSRIVRQILTESLTLAFLGGLAGLWLAFVGVDALAGWIVTELPRSMQPQVNGRAFAFCVLLTSGTGLLFGLLPALRARHTDLTRDLKAGAGASPAARLRAQSLLVVAEIALTCCLLIAAGLLLRSLSRLFQAQLGFEPQHVLACDVAMTPEKYAGPEAMHAFDRAILARLQAIPGVEAVGITTTVPLSREAWGGAIRLTADPENPAPGGTEADYVAGDYFGAMGMAPLAGRLFREEDHRPGAPPVAVIDQRLASSILPGLNPLGHRIRFGRVDFEIVGVVPTVRHLAPDDVTGRHAYFPHHYNPEQIRLLLRSSVDPLTLADDVKAALASIDPDQSVSNFRTLDQTVSRAMRDRRVVLVLVGGFASVALGLACLGIYGVLAFTIGQRRHEMSVRLALGAAPLDLVRLILREGLRLALAGLALGLLLGAGASRLLTNRLYEISPADPVVYLTVTIVVALVVVLTMLGSARRTTRIDSLGALHPD